MSVSFFPLRLPPRSPLFPYTTLFRSLGQTARASETLACPGEVPVIDIESRGVVERARHLIEKPELLINIEALLAGHDCGLDVTAVVVRLRDTGVQRCGCWQIAELVR